MPKNFGYRARTRDMFAKPFRKHGMPQLSTYLRLYRLGDIVDIKANGAIHKGMPHKFYHGRTGIVWNVTPHAVGVIVNKIVGNRVIPKKIHVRIEHVSHSKCRKDFLDRVAKNDLLKKEAKASGSKLSKGDLKRLPKMPKPGKIVSTRKTEVVSFAPEAFELLV